MADTHIDDVFTYNLAGKAHEKSLVVLALIKKAQSICVEIEQITDAETPELEDAIVTAEALVADISDAIDEWEQAA